MATHVRSPAIPPASPSGAGRPLSPAQSGNLLTLPFPLIGGGMATLAVPIPLSEENFDYLTGMLGSTLEGMKKALVRAEAKTQQADKREDG